MGRVLTDDEECNVEIQRRIDISEDAFQKLKQSIKEQKKNPFETLVSEWGSNSLR